MKLRGSSTGAPLVRPVELAALAVDRSAVIEASAGTGKTYLLEHLVLDLIIRGRARLDEILIVTFTERATEELLVRVRRKLDQALMLAEGSGGDTSSASGAQTTDASGWTIDDAARARLSVARQSFDQATIATIHAFCQRVLTEEPFATGRAMGQKQVDGRRVFGETFRDRLRHVFTQDPTHRPYLDAYLGAGGSVRLLEDLLYKVATERGRFAAIPDDAHIAEIARGTAALDVPALSVPLRGLLATNSIKALRDRLAPVAGVARAAIAPGNWGAFLSALDDATDPIFERHLETIALSRDATPAVAHLRALVPGLLGLPSLDEVVAQRFLPIVDAALTQRKRSDGSYDYDDMIRAVDDALGGAHGPALIRKLRGRYRYALVDEAQDTEPAQWRIFRRLFLDSGSANPVVLIGDPKQAIYGFRGADVRTYVAAREDIRATGGSVVPLRRNFRSHPEVVDAVNAILDHDATSRYFSDGDIAYDQPVSSELPRLGRGPAVTLLRAEPSASLGRIPRVGEVKHALQRAIAGAIRRLRADAPDTRLHDIFVLTRSNAEAADIGAELRRAGIAHALYKPDRLFETKEAADVRALLAALADPTDRVARMQAWLTPFFDLELGDLETHADPPADHPLIARLAAWKTLADARAIGDLGARILDDSGITRRLRLLPSGQRRLANYRQLIDWLLAQVAAGPVSVSDLTATLASRAASRGVGEDEDDDTQRVETEDDAVQIMTVHKAKGLEADIVFLYGGLTKPRVWRHAVHSFHHDADRLICVGKPKRARTIDEIDASRRQEDQRLLYVAMTRARRHLFLPFFPSAGVADADDHREGGELDAFKRITGEYRHVNQRLRALAEAGRLDEHFRVTSFAVPAPSDDDTSDLRAALARADVAMDVGAEAADAEPPDAARLRTSRRGFVVTSYSRIKDAHGGYNPPAAAAATDDPDLLADAEIEPAGPISDDEAGATAAANATPATTAAEVHAGDDAEAAREASGDVLPGGAASGLFLHGVLERVALGELPPFAEWQRRADVQRVLTSELGRWDREPRHLAAAAHLTYAALTATIPMPDGVTLPGMARASRVRREVSFLFPLPDIAPGRERRRVPDDDGRAVVVSRDDAGPRRGFVRGILDVLFEHEGRICFADWKSDVLPGFGAKAIRAHVESNYTLQLQIYTLALVRLLGVNNAADYDQRFGGLVYIFLRGLRAAGDGPPQPAGSAMFVDRPAYADVLRWDRELAAVAAPAAEGAS